MDNLFDNAADFASNLFLAAAGSKCTFTRKDGSTFITTAEFQKVVENENSDGTGSTTNLSTGTISHHLVMTAGQKIPVGTTVSYRGNMYEVSTFVGGRGLFAHIMKKVNRKGTR